MKRTLQISALTVATAAASLLLPLSGAVPARADDVAGFVDALNAAGVPMVSGVPRAVQGGYNVCNMLRGGMSVEQVSGMASMIEAPTIGAFISAAQQHLCPDTLK